MVKRKKPFCRSQTPTAGRRVTHLYEQKLKFPAAFDPCLLNSHELQICTSFDRYIQEGSSVTVVGVLCKSNDTMTIVQPPELISTGCLWQRLLFPVDIDGLILGIPDMTSPVTNLSSIQHPEQ